MSSYSQALAYEQYYRANAPEGQEPIFNRTSGWGIQFLGYRPIGTTTGPSASEMLKQARLQEYERSGFPGSYSEFQSSKEVQAKAEALETTKEKTVTVKTGDPLKSNVPVYNVQGRLIGFQDKQGTLLTRARASELGIYQDTTGESYARQEEEYSLLKDYAEGQQQKQIQDLTNKGYVYSEQYGGYVPMSAVNWESQAPTFKEQYMDFVNPSWNRPFKTLSKTVSFGFEKLSGKVSGNPLPGKVQQQYAASEFLRNVAEPGIQIAKFSIPVIGPILLAGESGEMIVTSSGRQEIKEYSKYLYETKGIPEVIGNVGQYTAYGSLTVLGLKSAVSQWEGLPIKVKKITTSQAGFDIVNVGNNQGIIISENYASIEGRKAFLPVKLNFKSYSFTPYKQIGEEFSLGKPSFVSYGYDVGKYNLLKLGPSLDPFVKIRGKGYSVAEKKLFGIPEINIGMTYKNGVQITRISETTFLKEGFGSAEVGVADVLKKNKVFKVPYMAEGNILNIKEAGNTRAYYIRGETSTPETLSILELSNGKNYFLDLKASPGKNVAQFEGISVIHTTSYTPPSDIGFIKTSGKKSSEVFLRQLYAKEIQESSMLTSASLSNAALNIPSSSRTPGLFLIKPSMPEIKTEEKVTASNILSMGLIAGELQPSLIAEKPGRVTRNIFKPAVIDILQERSKPVEVGRFFQVPVEGEKIGQVQVLRLGTRTLNIPRINIPFVNPIIETGEPGFIFGGYSDVNLSFKEGKIGNIFAKQPQKYQADLTALLQNIYGTRPRIITGLEIRPKLRRK